MARSHLRPRNLAADTVSVVGGTADLPIADLPLVSEVLSKANRSKAYQLKKDLVDIEMCPTRKLLTNFMLILSVFTAR